MKHPQSLTRLSSGTKNESPSWSHPLGQIPSAHWMTPPMTRLSSYHLYLAFISYSVNFKVVGANFKGVDPQNISWIWTNPKTFGIISGIDCVAINNSGATNLSSKFLQTMSQAGAWLPSPLVGQLILPLLLWSSVVSFVCEISRVQLHSSPVYVEAYTHDIHKQLSIPVYK